MESALCRQVDGNLWFPEQGASLNPARKICASCTVRIACLDYAITTGQTDGVWGGMGPTERKEEIKRRRTVTT